MFTWLKQRLSALTQLVHAMPGSRFSLLPRTKYDYRRQVGDGYGSSVIMAPVKFIQRVFPEAPLQVKRKTGKEEEIFEDHPLIQQVRKPNGFYSGNALWRGTIACWILNGNAYWWKLRNLNGQVIQLWWIPPWLIEPKWPKDGSVFISHYEYKASAATSQEIKVKDVVHFRNGLDPRNPRLGMSDLHSVLREVFSDDEASNYTASILRNMGTPGLIISPKQGTADPDDVNAVKQKARQLAGDRRGEPLVMKGPTEVTQFTWSPAQMELGSLRDVSEERVCAVLGIPAAVVGFGSGLQQTKVGATMVELVRLAWMSGIGPMQNVMANDLETQLLPDFAAEDGLELAFDSSQVEALQESQREKATRFNIGVRGGWTKVAEARRAFKLPVSPSDEVYLRAGNVAPVSDWGKPAGGKE